MTLSLDEVRLVRALQRSGKPLPDFGSAIYIVTNALISRVNGFNSQGKRAAEVAITNFLKTIDMTWLTGMLESVWTGVATGETSWMPLKSCIALHEEYAASGKTAEECAENFIAWQTTKAGASGFVLGLSGLTFAGVTIPADLAATTFLQMRMVAVIALLYGWDHKSDRVKTIAMLSLLESSGGEALRDVGLAVAPILAKNAIAGIPGSLLIEINKAVGFRLLTKFGSKGAINLVKLVPLAGGMAGGAVNAFATMQIGRAASRYLAGGPPSSFDDADSAPAMRHSPEGLSGGVADEG